MLDMMETLSELLYSLRDKDDPPLVYIKALELAIDEINNNGRVFVKFENPYEVTP